MTRRLPELTCLLLLAPACASTQHDTSVPANQAVATEHPTPRVPVPHVYEAPMTPSPSIDPVVAERMDMRLTAQEAMYTEVDPFIEPTLTAACGWEKPTFYFSSDDADVGLVGEVKMNALATCLTSEPLRDQPVVVVGFADERGETYENLELGLDRAKAVKSELVAQGVDPGRIETYSRGEYTEDEDESLDDDRRVVVKLDR